MSQLADAAADPRAGNVSDYGFERTPRPTAEQSQALNRAHEQAADRRRSTVTAPATADVRPRFHSVEERPASRPSHERAIIIGINMVKTADTTMAGTNNLLRAMRALTIHAANSGVKQACVIPAGQVQIVKMDLFTRHQIALQAGYPMLAKANDVPQVILEMLQ